MEEWRDVDEFPGFAVSSEGRILNDWTTRILATRQNQQGVVMVGLQRDGQQHMRSVPLLVAKAFLEPPRNEFYNSIIHLNGDRSDCRAENLMWRPRWFAIRYHHMFQEEPYDVGVYIADTDESFDTLREACVKYGLVEKLAYVDMLNQDPVFHYNWIFKRLIE